MPLPRRRDIADGFDYAAMIEPVDRAQGDEFDCLSVAPKPAAMDDLGLVREKKFVLEFTACR